MSANASAKSGPACGTPARGERAPPAERERLADQQLRGDARAQQYLQQCRQRVRGGGRRRRRGEGLLAGKRAAAAGS